MKIWKVFLGILLLIIGTVLFAESEEVSTKGQLAKAIGANVEDLTLYAGYIVSILYIVISILLFACLNKITKEGDFIIVILSIVAFFFSFQCPKIFVDLPHTSFLAGLCFITSIISISTSKERHNPIAVINAKCPQCGAQIEESDSFCRSCGKELPKEIICPQCGASIDKSARFCSNCGTNLSEPNADTVEQIVEDVEDEENPMKKYLFYVIVSLVLWGIVGLVLWGIYGFPNI